MKSNRSGKAKVLDLEQMKKLWAELDQPHRISTQIAYYTASRISEVLSLDSGDVRDNQIVFRAGNTKTGASKTSVVAPPLQRAIVEADLPKSGPLFPTVQSGNYQQATVKRYRQKYRNGHKKNSDYYEGFDVLDTGRARHVLSRQAVDSALRKAIAVLGDEFEGVTTHSFRRSFLTRLRVEHGWSYEALMKVSGHKSVSSLVEYLDVDTQKVHRDLMQIAD